MTVKDLIEKLSACPPECRVLVLLGGELVDDVKGMEVASTLEDYPCTGFDDAFEGLRGAVRQESCDSHVTNGNPTEVS